MLFKFSDFLISLNIFVIQFLVDFIVSVFEWTLMEILPKM